MLCCEHPCHSAAGAAALPAADSEDEETSELSADLLAFSIRTVKRIRRSTDGSEVKFGVYNKNQVCTPLRVHLNTSSFFLISLSLMQAISFAVPYSFAIFGPETA